MKLTTSKVIATGAVALAMLPAAAFADDGAQAKVNLGLHLGAINQLFAGLHQNREDNDDQGQNNDRNERGEHKHATSTVATTSPQQFTINGSVTFVSGSTITVQGAHGATYTVNAGNASVTGSSNAALSIGAIKVGDTVSVTGSLSGSVVNATKIRDRSDVAAKAFRSLEAGIVTAINGATVSLSNFGTSGSSTFVTNAATKYDVNGAAASSSALQVGSHVLVLGTTTAGTNDSLNASIVVILTDGLNWLKHFWK